MRLERRSTVIAGLLAIILMSALLWLDSHLTRYTIVDFELAHTSGTAQQILTAWGEHGRQWATWSVWLDFLFIPCYALFLAGLILIEVRRPRLDVLLQGPIHPGWWRTVGLSLAWALFLAASLDVVENGLLLHSLDHWQSVVPTVAGAAFWAAVAKFLILMLCVLYVLFSWSERPYRWQLPLWQWFFSYPVLILEAVAIVLIAWSVLARPFGIPDLFWHEGLWMQLWAGVGVGLLLLDLGFAGFLLDSDPAMQQGWRVSFFGLPPWSWKGNAIPLATNDADLLRYLLRTSGVLWVLVALGAFSAPEDIAVWPLPVAALLVLVTLPFTAIRVREWLFGTPSDPEVALRGAPQALQNQVGAIPSRAQRDLHKSAFYYFFVRLGLFFILWAIYYVLDWDASAALAICLILGTVAATYGFVRFHFAGQSFGLVFLSVVALVAISSLGGHQLPDLDYDERVLLEHEYGQTQKPDLLDSRAVLDKWLSRGGKRPLFVVAADGGGIRAGVWTMTVLRQLEDDIPKFPDHVRLITGASGGMLGAGFYVASLREEPEGHHYLEKELNRDCLVQWTGRDGLGLLVRQLVFGDLFSPPALFPKSHRGHALELAWQANTRPWSGRARPPHTYDGVLSTAFVDLKSGEDEGWRPSLVVSPMIIEDGRRLLISNLSLEKLTRIPLPTPTPISVLQAVEFFRMFPDASKLRLSSAIHMNAAFPYVSPPVELPTVPARHVLDAGFYDEHGVDLATTWLWLHREWIEANVSGVALLQIPDSRSLRAKEAPSLAQPKWWQRGAAELIGPAQALHSGWSSGQAFRNDQLLRVVGAFFNRADRPDFFRTFVFEPDAGPLHQSRGAKLLSALVGRGEDDADQDVALSWRLTTAELERLASSFYQSPAAAPPADGVRERLNCKRRRQLQDWWVGHGGASSQEVKLVECEPGKDEAPSLKSCPLDDRTE